MGQQWFQHNDMSIIKFYQNSIPDNAPHLHLIQKLFTYSKILVTFWEGEDVFNKLQKIKGASHPADAREGTIRSSFFCDNSITNLVHTSDNSEEMLNK
ncbi:MAG: nucleoside-diphosphate kinase [bacterium]